MEPARHCSLACSAEGRAAAEKSDCQTCAKDRQSALELHLSARAFWLTCSLRCAGQAAAQEDVAAGGAAAHAASAAGRGGRDRDPEHQELAGAFLRQSCWEAPAWEHPRISGVVEFSAAGQRLHRNAALSAHITEGRFWQAL